MNEIIETLCYETLNDIEILSTHSSVESCFINDVEIGEIEDLYTNAEVEGVVKVRLQYGSNYDLKNDDGLVTDMDFPFTASFHCRLNIEGDTEYELENNTLKVDTDSFYK